KPDAMQVKQNIELLWQQQGGGGKGDQQSENQEGESDQQDSQQDAQGDQNQQSNSQPQQRKPQPFKSQELSQDQVRKILEELKNQEQKIRAMEYEEKGGQNATTGKEW